jgi:hypothetical protein
LLNLSEKCEFNAEFYNECVKYKTTFFDIFVLNESPDILIKNLKFGRVLFKLFPELKEMNNIYQDKKRNHSLFDHSISVLHYTHKQTNYAASLITAFMHDFGKIFTEDNNFKKHDHIGLIKTEEFLHKYNVPKNIREDVKKMLKHHTQVSQYQREPNWTDEAIKKFMRKTHPLTMETISIAKADKQASHDYEPYLIPYEDLRNRCLEFYTVGINI